MTTNKTLDLDKLFVRDIYFKDYSNRPISANKILTTRGDGGIYFGNQTTGQQYPAFNEFRAGSNITTPASNIYNTLWFEQGAGIQFYNVLDGLQPKTFIASTAPEQITVLGDGGTVNFSSLKENLVGGRTLFFDYKGDATINVSDTTVTFGTAYNSSYSSLTILTSTTIGLQNETSTIQGDVRTTINTVDTLLISTTLSTFYSTLEYTTNIAEKTSSFVFSTFNLFGGSSKLAVGELQAIYVSSSVIAGACIIGDVIKVGSNVITESNITGSNADSCTAYLSTGIASTYTNYFNIQDTYSGAKFSIEKNRIFSFSTYGTSSIQVIGNQVQVGWFPQFSTQSGTLPPSVRDNYIPILQQTEVIEQTVEANMSTVTNYSLKNVGKFDEICAQNNLTITAPNVIIQRLTVDNINSLNPFKAEFLSTFSTLYVSSAFGTNLNISTVRYSTLRGHNIRTEFISTTELSTNNGFIETLGYSTLQGVIGYSETVSTIHANFDIATGNGVSTNYISTGNMAYDQAIGNNLYGSNLGFVSATGSHISTQNLFTESLGFDKAAGNTLSTGNLSFGIATGDSLNVSSINTYRINVITISSYNVSTVNAFFENLDFSTIAGHSIQASVISTNQIVAHDVIGSTIVARDATVYKAHISDLSFSSIRNVPFISSFSTFYISTAQIINGTVSSLRVSTIMGTELPIFTFDMEHRRVGLNLGATQQPRATMDISGVVYANNFVTTSDRRLKSHIEPLCISNIPRSYRYLQKETGDMDIGVMADEVERIAPECVYTRTDGYKAVSYMKLVPVCLSLIQSLSDRLAALESEKQRNM